MSFPSFPLFPFCIAVEQVTSREKRGENLSEGEARAKNARSRRRVSVASEKRASSGVYLKGAPFLVFLDGHRAKSWKKAKKRRLICGAHLVFCARRGKEMPSAIALKHAKLRREDDPKKKTALGEGKEAKKVRRARLFFIFSASSRRKISAFHLFFPKGRCPFFRNVVVGRNKRP